MQGGCLVAWSGLEVLRPLAGGARSAVFLARRRGAEFVVRVSTRGPEALEWELDLQEHLADHGVRVPRSVPADDGRRHVAGVTVQERLSGRRPRDIDDWASVVAALRVVHEMTMRWPQRPGFASSCELQRRTRGGDVDLSVMPGDAVELIRRVCRRLDQGAPSAIHGDVGVGNILIEGDKVGLIDWDESRVDVPWFDFAHLPPEVLPATPFTREQLITAGVAWEAATCWIAEPDYAAGQLEELRQRDR